MENASCLLCGVTTDAYAALCTPCRDGLPYLHNACLRCAIELGNDPPTHRHCPECIVAPPYFDYCLALGRYEFPLQELISSFKFNAKLCAGRALACVLAQMVAQHCRTAPPDALLPVPLHAHRMRTRGFNQSMEIAKIIAPIAKVPITPRLCRRQRATRPQRDLSAEQRTTNLMHAFSVYTGQKMPHHVLIVDDVVTTKSTVNTIAHLLKRAGVRKVGVACLARVS